MKLKVVSVEYLCQQGKTPSECVSGCLEECNQAQAGTCPQNQAQRKQACDRRAEAALFGCLHVLESSVCVKIEGAACILTSTERSHFNGASP